MVENEKKTNGFEEDVRKAICNRLGMGFQKFALPNELGSTPVYLDWTITEENGREYINIFPIPEQYGDEDLSYNPYLKEALKVFGITANTADYQIVFVAGFMDYKNAPKNVEKCNFIARIPLSANPDRSAYEMAKEVDHAIDWFAGAYGKAATNLTSSFSDSYRKEQCQQ